MEPPKKRRRKPQAVFPSETEWLSAFRDNTNMPDAVGQEIASFLFVHWKVGDIVLGRSVTSERLFHEIVKVTAKRVFASRLRHRVAKLPNGAPALNRCGCDIWHPGTKHMGHTRWMTKRGAHLILDGTKHVRWDPIRAGHEAQTEKQHREAADERLEQLKASQKLVHVK